MSDKRSILVAEDDASIRLGLVDSLEGEGYAVIAATNGEEAVACFKEFRPELVLLDIMMPKLNGYDVCREIRQRDKAVPVIMLSAKSEEIDKVLGLELGADDYMTKPFGVRELLARVAAALRRCDNTGHAETSPTAAIPFGRALIDPVRRLLTRDGEDVALTQLEYRLLMVFHEHADSALSRDFLLNQAWGIDYAGTTRTLDQHVSQLRRKIEADPARPACLLTVHGYGYRYLPTREQ